MDIPAPLERHEYKYRIAPALIPAVRDHVLRYCDLDRPSAAGPYLISTLYLDSPHRILYRHTRQQRARRFKLRARRYRNGPVFLETKRRDRRVVTKTRVAVDPRSWPGVVLDPRALADCGVAPAHAGRLHAFLDSVARIHGEPAVVVRYTRLAFVSRSDRYGRITIDTRLEAVRPNGYDIPVDDAPGVPFDGSDHPERSQPAAILELKCTRAAVPLWMTDLVRRFDLQARGFSKYAFAVECLRDFPRDLVSVRRRSARAFGGRWQTF